MNLPTADRSWHLFWLVNVTESTDPFCISNWVFCSRKNSLLRIFSSRSHDIAYKYHKHIGAMTIISLMTDRFIPHDTMGAGGIGGDSVKWKGFSQNPCSFSPSERVTALINIHLNSWHLYLARLLVAFCAFKCLLQKSSFRDGIGKSQKATENVCVPGVSTFY